MFLSLPLVARRRLRRRSVLVQRLPDQVSLRNRAEIFESIVVTDIPVVQSDQDNMAGMEEMMRHFQESIQAM
mgnify:CR=1 FL=1